MTGLIQRRTALRSIGLDVGADAAWGDDLQEFRDCGLLPVATTADLIRWLDYAGKHPTITLIEGQQGLGKTVTAQAFASAEAHRDRVVYVECPDAETVTAGGLLRQLAAAAGIPAPNGVSKCQLKRDLALTLRARGGMLIIDEACRLRRGILDMLRWIHDAHPFEGIDEPLPMVLLGGPQLLSVVSRSEELASRVGYYRRMRALNRTEVRDLFAAYSADVARVVYEATAGKLRRLLAIGEHLNDYVRRHQSAAAKLTASEAETIAATYLIPISA